MVESKNLKLKLGLCGLALTSFLALNTHNNTVHADTVNGSNADAITWDSDQDDSQVVKEEPQQEKPAQSVQMQGAVQNQNTSAVQSVQANSQNRAEKSAVRVSNFDTSVVNRNSVQNARPQANVKVATVHDTAQMPVQKQKVAQFNQGSKIYTLNGSNQLSKNNGDGYVITNAGMYNGRAVDIGVTINNVQDNQGTYTTKWSNGDHADVTGKTDDQFNYQNSVLAGSKSVTPQLNQTRPRNEKQNENVDISGVWVYGDTDNWEEPGDTSYDRYAHFVHIIAPELLKQVMEQANAPVNEALAKFTEDNFASKLVSCHVNITDKTYVDKYFVGSPGYFSAGNTGAELPHVTRNFLYHVSFNKGVHVSDLLMTDQDRTSQTYGQKILDTSLFEWPIDKDKNLPPVWANGDTFPPAIDDMTIPDAKFDANEGYNSDLVWTNDFNKVSEYDDWSLADGPLHQKGIKKTGDFTTPNLATYKITTDPVSATLTKDVQVTDHLQADKVTNGSLNYNYTVGLYDAQTGDLITDLKAEYKGQTGMQATASSSVMNNAIKNKIQQINQNKATVSYTGTSANDDVAFYQETRQVNPQDKNVNRQVQRVIHINFPNGVKPASYDSITDSEGNKLTLDSNNNLTQSMSFTRTGVQNIVSGHVTYGKWQKHGAINAVTLPSIPGYTMVTNN